MHELSVRVRIYYGPLSAARGTKERNEELENRKAGGAPSRQVTKFDRAKCLRNIIMRARSRRVSSHLIHKRIACDR